MLSYLDASYYSFCCHWCIVLLIKIQASIESI